MKLHRELGIGQKSAWFMLHRLRKAYEIEVGPFSGTVEVDETFIGGKEKNKHNSKRSHIQGPSGKEVVVGMKDRKTNKVIAKPVPARTKEELQGFISANVSCKAMVYTDDHKSYTGLPFEHESVNHSVGEYVSKEASSYERSRKLLGDVKKRLLRNLSPHIPKAPGPLRKRVQRQA